ncbi:MAG TPA: IS1182 family transposase [Pyrinomonadaceae bacterium]|jgi:transposase
MGYIKGSQRSQGLLLPRTIDDYIAANNAVRAIAAFLERLDFVKLGFVRAEAAATGRPGYDPRIVMGLYLWGHLNGQCSSRKLARECHRNLEVIWLCQQLHPDFKTIADFRTANAAGIKGVLVEFRRWCVAAGLYGKEIVAVDGSKFKAVNSKQRNYTAEKLKKILARERVKIAEYLAAMDAADAAEAEEEETELTAEQLKEKIASLDRYLAEHEQLAQELDESGESQVSLTDPDAKLMKTARGSEVSYNVQTVVDSKLKLLVTYEVTNEVNDLGQLAVMAEAAQQALEVEELTVLADGGYYEGSALKECEEAKLMTYVPPPRSGAAKGRGVFANTRFQYEAARDVYLCPQGEAMTFRGMTKKKGKQYKIYRTKACAGCPLRLQCTTSKRGRKILRWVDQEVLERLQARNRGRPELLKLRKALAEHPFGTIKASMNQGGFLLKGIHKVSIEFGLTMLSYNFKRVLNHLGVERMLYFMDKPELCTA